MYVPDNYDRFEQYDAEREKALWGLPECDCCGEPIQSEYYYEIDGEKICEACLNGFKKYID